MCGTQRQQDNTDQIDPETGPIHSSTSRCGAIAHRDTYISTLMMMLADTRAHKHRTIEGKCHHKTPGFQTQARSQLTGHHRRTRANTHQRLQLRLYTPTMQPKRDKRNRFKGHTHPNGTAAFRAKVPGLMAHVFLERIPSPKPFAKNDQSLMHYQSQNSRSYRSARLV